MNNDTKKDIFNEEKKRIIDKKLEEILLNNPNIIKDNEILEIEYNIDGTKKDLYQLASEKNIRETQHKSDINTIDFKYSQKQITKTEYDEEKRKIDEAIEEENLVYNDLMFEIINNTSLEDIKKSILSYNLNEIDLMRLKDGINSVCNYKIDEFTTNNKKFMIDKFTYWNYKYNQLSKAISKSREVESFILNLIK